MICFYGGSHPNCFCIALANCKCHNSIPMLKYIGDKKKILQIKKLLLPCAAHLFQLLWQGKTLISLWLMQWWKVLQNHPLTGRLVSNLLQFVWACCRASGSMSIAMTWSAPRVAAPIASMPCTACLHQNWTSESKQFGTCLSNQWMLPTETNSTSSVSYRGMIPFGAFQIWKSRSFLVVAVLTVPQPKSTTTRSSNSPKQPSTCSLSNDFGTIAQHP